MKYLLDTQTLLWFQAKDSRLNQSISDLIVTPENQIYVSDTSLYEIAIKLKINKLPELHASVRAIILVGNRDKIEFLPISHAHLVNYDAVPFIADHRDPFDRLIIAVALTHSFPIITADAKFTYYESMVTVINARKPL